VLDVMLPDMDGFDVARRLGAQRADVPIIFLTARDATEDKVRGLTMGGDDYVTKPFSLEELVARIRTILRRAGMAKPESGRLSFEDVELDEGATLAGATGLRPLHPGDDHGLLPHPEVGDVGLLGAVEVPAGIVLDQIQYVADPEHPEPFLEARGDAGEPGDRNVLQVPQRLAHCRPSVSALLS